MAPPENSNAQVRKPAETQARIMNAAVQLFSQVGYNAASTRELARKADINEATLFRYHARKKDLFLAAIESELQSVTVHADLLSQLAASEDVRSKLQTLFLIIADIVFQRPGAIRLLQFGMLEFGPEIEPIAKKYFMPLVDAFEGIVSTSSLRGRMSGRIPLFAFLGTAIALRSLYPFFGGQPLSSSALAEVGFVQADAWLCISGDSSLSNGRRCQCSRAGCKQRYEVDSQ